MKRPIITINTIEHDDQRYPTWADWELFDYDAMGYPLLSVGVLPESQMRISVSHVGNWRYEYLAAIHELLEATVCRHMGITQDMVDAFDVDYENRRIAGERRAACGCEITSDPGSDYHAPYKLAHKYAESVEYGLARVLGVDARSYDEAFFALDGGVILP